MATKKKSPAPGAAAGASDVKPKKARAGTRDSRQHPRVPLDLLVQMTSDSIAQFRQVHAQNISLGGMFIVTEKPRAVGAQVFFQFTVKDGGTLIEGLGRVVHASAHGMGVEFVSVLEPSASIIRKLVKDRLASSRA